MLQAGQLPLLNYWVATRPIAGEKESGDQYVVAGFDGGVLVAVIDGLGHGEEASQAAMLATEVLAENAHDPVVLLMKRCHEALRKTRGAVMSIASFNAASATMTWVGIGNVEGMLLCTTSPESVRRASLVPRGGIVGDRMPQLVAATVPVEAGDLLVFATDGIGSMFVRDIRKMEHPSQLIHHIFQRHAKTTDDALILGAQWTNREGALGSTDSSDHQPASRTSP